VDKTNLKEYRNWLVWKIKSAPTSALTGQQKGWQQNLATYAEAAEFCNIHDGYQLGFCFSEDCPVVGLDYDGCRNPETGETAAWEAEVPYTGWLFSNVSVSGSGLKALFHCKQKDLKRTVRHMQDVESYGDHSPQIELFTNSKYFALTVSELPDDATTLYDNQQLDLMDLIQVMGTSDIFATADVSGEAVDGCTSPLELQRLLNEVDVTQHKDRESWIRLMQSAHHGTGGSDEGFEVFDAWCQGDPETYSEDDCRRDWFSLKTQTSNPVTIGTLIHEAYPDGKKEEWDPAEFFDKVEVLGEVRSECWPGLLIEEYRNHKEIALLFQEEYGGLVRFVGQWGKWVYYNGVCWEVDNSGTGAHGKVLEFIGTLRDKIPKVDTEQAAKAKNFVTSLGNYQQTKGLMGQIKGLPGMQITVGEIEFKANLLNLRNGTLNLTTMELQKHNANDFIFGNADVEYVEDQCCPTWDRVINDIFDGDKDLSDYVQTLFGYAISGTTELEVFPVAYGGGCNGKSTIVQTLERIMGDYSTHLPSEIFDAKQTQHPTYVAKLKGARVAIVAELESDLHLSESMVKKITSQDAIEARRMREDPWTFTPSHTTLLCTNHKPVVKGTDNGIWRRLKLIPFTVDLTEVVDPTIPGKLDQEFSGILNWILSGYVRYKSEGLKDCKAVSDATAEYRKSEDVFGSMFEELFEKSDCDTKTQDAFSSYQRAGGRLGRYKFNSQMEEHGHPKTKKQISGERFWVFEGIQLAKEQV
jgi:putative DNA primase/helicase